MKLTKVVIGLAGVFGLAVAGTQLWQKPADSFWPRQELLVQQPQVADAISSADLAGAEQLSRAFRNAARMVRPSVVKITALVERRVTDRYSGDYPEIPEQFRGLLPDEFFAPRRSPRQRVPRESQEKQNAGVGSGVIVSPNGYILTNNHVVQEADELKVHMSDGRAFEAKVVGTDPKTDVALIKIEASGLVAARIGDSDHIDVGDWVIAVGSPFDLEQTVTAGIISAKHRDVQILDELGSQEDFLQTDAAINPGNSGGPLVNLRGEVVGINTAIKSSVGTNAGVGFAVPSNLAQFVMQSILKSGKVVRGFLGVTLDEITPEIAQSMDLPATFKGIVVKSVGQDTPASKGGLKAGDLVTAINGQPVDSINVFRQRVSLTEPGQTVNLQVNRNGRQQSVRITVEEATDERLAAISGRVAIGPLGLVVNNITPQIAKELGLEEDAKGAVVVGVDPRSPAARAIEPGDIILQVNGQDITSAGEVAPALAKNKRAFRIVVRRGETDIQFSGTIN